VGSEKYLAATKIWKQPDTAATPYHFAASRYAPLRWWDVITTTTLYEIQYK